MPLQPEDFRTVVATLRNWTPEMKLLLAQELLNSLRPLLTPDGLPGVPAKQVVGIGAGEAPPPDDETVKRWIHEHRMEKYG